MRSSPPETRNAPKPALWGRSGMAPRNHFNRRAGKHHHPDRIQRAALRRSSFGKERTRITCVGLIVVPCQRRHEFPIMADFASRLMFEKATLPMARPEFVACRRLMTLTPISSPKLAKEETMGEINRFINE